MCIRLLTGIAFVGYGCRQTNVLSEEEDRGAAARRNGQNARKADGGGCFERADTGWEDQCMKLKPLFDFKITT